MGEANSSSVVHVGYDIKRVEKYRNPRATEGESICIARGQRLFY
jgi:hypothetical protein